MNNFVIDNVIKEDYEFLRKFCEFMSEAGYESEFAPPMTLEEVEKWEKDNDTELPSGYKSWLLLTAESNIMDYIILAEPVIGTLEEENDIVIIGTAVGDGEEVGIRRSDGSVYSIFDGEVREYKDFDDFLTVKLYFLEEIAEEEIGEDWEDQMNEMFGEE